MSTNIKALFTTLSLTYKQVGKTAIYITTLLSITIACNVSRSNRVGIVDSDQGNLNPVIVFFHGLGASASDFNALQDRLTQTFPTATMIALKSIEAYQSYDLTIDEQVDRSFKELRPISNLHHRDLLLIGHSQGGVRAYALYKKYRNQLNIRGIVTLATLWEGAPALDVDNESINKNVNAILEDSTKLYPTQGLMNFIIKLIRNSIYCSKASPSNGGRDLKVGSTFLSQIQKDLVNNKVPILAIGAVQREIKSLLGDNSGPLIVSPILLHHLREDLDADWVPVGLDRTLIKRLFNNYCFDKQGIPIGNPKYDLICDHIDKQYAQILLGKEADGQKEQQHDGMVPLSSQCAHRIVPNQNHFQRFVIKDTDHCSLLGNSEMIKKVEAFARKQLQTRNRIRRQG